MSKNNVSEWDVVADNNIIIKGININENCPPSAINNAIREMMAQIKMWKDGYTDPISGLPVYQSLVVQNIDVKGIIKLDGSAGTDGQVLSSKGSSASPVWKTLGTMSNQNSNAVNITGGTIKGLSNLTTTNLTSTNATFANTNTTGLVKFDGSTGSPGQVLTSKGGTTPKWEDAFIKGMIMLWSGAPASIPSGWRLCDGAGGTPNLRDRFVVGAGGSYVAGRTGGTVTATTNIKSLTTSSKSVVVGRDGWGTVGGPLGTAVNGRLLVGSGQNEYKEGLESIRASGNNMTTAAHNHTIGSHNHTVDTRSPYYALAYIMKL